MNGVPLTLLACLRLAWVDQGSTTQGLLKIAVPMQNIATRGIANVSSILSGNGAGTFSNPTPAIVFSTSNPGDLFERLGKPLRYEASHIGTVSNHCCLTSSTPACRIPLPQIACRAMARRSC